MIFIPWALVTLVWYLCLIYRVFFYKESKKRTRDFGIKILTIGDQPEVLKKTISSCPVPPKVISRVKTGLPSTYVMPDDFESSARYKGQQMEWARVEHPYDYTVYLDEDSIFSAGVQEIPDADIVQFNEVPITKNWLIGAIEAHRIGFQTEQVAFEKIKPFYLWGGGFAIKRHMEDLVTWDRESITEDTAFMFLVSDEAKFKFSKIRIYNQAPPNLKSLIKQRRRWASGALEDIRYHPDWRYRAWIAFRSINWGMWPLLVPMSILMATNHIIFILPMIQTMIWSFAGARVMQQSLPRTVFSVVIAPIAGLFHSLGACLAFVSQARAFDVTPKEVSSRAYQNKVREKTA